MSHISPVEKIEGQTSFFFFFFTKTGPSFHLSNGQAAFSMPLVYSFYCKEFVVSLSSRFQSSGWSMSPEDPVSGQVPSGVIGSVPICLCSSKNFIHLNGSSLEARVLSPKRNFLN